MVNFEEIQKALDEIQAGLDKLNNDIEEFKYNNEVYKEKYYIDSFGKVCSTNGLNKNALKELKDCMNLFNSEIEARFELKKRIVIENLCEHGGQTCMPRGDYTYLFVSGLSERLCFAHGDSDFDNGRPVYFKDDETAEKAVEAVGEEQVKKYIFGVFDSGKDV